MDEVVESADYRVTYTPDAARVVIIRAVERLRILTEYRQVRSLKASMSEKFQLLY